MIYRLGITVGTKGLGKAGTVGGVLNTIGAAAASRLMDKALQ